MFQRLCLRCGIKGDESSFLSFRRTGFNSYVCPHCASLDTIQVDAQQIEQQWESERPDSTDCDWL